MKWTESEVARLSPILEQVWADFEPLESKHVLVLCSAAGDVVFWLAEKARHGQIVGLELSDELLEVARHAAIDKNIARLVEFRQGAKTRIPLPGETFDGLVSEFVVFPTPVPTEIGQREMARVLKPGGKMVLTDVIVTKPVPPAVRRDLRAIGLDYLCEGTQDDFRRWMVDAGLINIEVMDFTPLVRSVWQQRRAADHAPEHREGYRYLLEDPEFKLGEAIFYIYVRGQKP